MDAIISDKEMNNEIDNLEEVVYCKDCKYLGVKDFAYGYCKHKMTGIIYPDYFCCYGELDKKKNKG